MLPSLAGAVTAAPVDQRYLFEARQMQALSFAVHIPLVCFGIAFPVMVLVMEWMGHRTGNPVYLAIARRWSRIWSSRPLIWARSVWDWVAGSSFAPPAPNPSSA